MQQGWVCIYCKHPNPYNARYCASCNARIPDLKQSFLAGIKEETAEGDSEKQDEAPFPIPKPGDMTGSLFELTEMVLSGEISPVEFSCEIRLSMTNIGSVFDSLCGEIETLAGDMADYADTVVSLLENVQFMLEKALEEMLLFAEDQDDSHLRFGKVLAQRAELEYIQILEMLKYDSSINPFEGAPNVLGNMARRYFEGELGLTAIRDELKEYEESTMSSLKDCKTALTEGFALAGKFDGNNREIITAAIDRLTEAADGLSKLIVNLHSQEEIGDCVVEMMEE